MNRANFIFEEQEIAGEPHPSAQKTLAPQMQLDGGGSQQSEQNSKPSQPLHGHKQEFHQAVHPNHTHQHPNNGLNQKRRERRKEGQLVTNEEDKTGNFGDEVEFKGVHDLLPPTIPKQRKKSTTYQDKADLFHSAQPSEIKPNLLVPEEDASPRHQKAQNFTLKPHHDRPLDYQPYSQQSRTQQLQQDTHHHGKKRKQSMDYRQPQDIVDKRNSKKLPAINNNTQVRNQQPTKNPIEIKQSSIIVLHSTDPKPKEQPFADSFHHLQQELIDSSLQHILKPLQAASTFTFARDTSIHGNYIHPRFELFNLQKASLISAQKQSCHWNSYYTFTHDKQEIGFLRGNFGGTEFNLYQLHDGRSQLVATIIYKSECSCGESSRDISVFIKTSRQADPVFEREASRKNLKELYEDGYSKEILKLRTKQPIWSQKTECFVLKLGGKGTLPSVKNMVLISQQSPGSQPLLFYKRAANTFHLQLCGPLSVFMGMGILMSSFDFKLLCQ